MTDLTMEQYEALYAQWQGGLVLHEIEELHGSEVRAAREMLELQHVAAMSGLDSMRKCSGAGVVNAWPTWPSDS